MKKQFIATLQEGDAVNDYFLATRKDLREQNSGGKFLGMVFKDRSGEIGGILWTNALAVARVFEVGDVVIVRGTVTSYQDRLQIRVDQVSPLKEGEFATEDLVVAPEDTAEILARLIALLDTVTNEWLKKLFLAFRDDPVFMKRFENAAAGKRWHHAFPGGLVRHCFEIAQIGLGACELFPTIDRDLFLMAAFLHDIGKLDEISQDLLIEYTTVGKLIGHLEIGANMVQRKMDAIDGFPETLRIHVMHCMLSHHGELINGSPVVPKTLEAMLLYHCDNLDAQIDALTRIIRETKEKRQEWSEFQPLISRQIWAK